ncbi:MAG: Flp family type IVb pilin [Chloroflexi bacterium]|nr:Flp family type IVb pilin [Chloroflexota bacterium]
MEVNKVADWFKREEGQGMVEYGLIIALVAVIVIGALTLLGNNLSSTFSGIAAAI